ncbi:hypothetical protein QQF64_036132 [Cirrhinus molitorella]|uniref:Uncharacterized protein n=1 Tax=Cirrhinus molitorella TaxID=172907 RepID=A0ABR3NHR7_9TELE
MSGFTEVTKEGISVAVARQVKGNYTKAALVKKAIDKCIDNSDLCYKVAEKLKNCRSTVESKPVSQTYTAVHAYLRESPKEAVYEDTDISDEDMSNQTPYILKGKCHKSPGVSGGKFVVFIKSGRRNNDNGPCSKLNCGMDQRGKCVRMTDVFLALCECKMHTMVSSVRRT